MKTTESDSLHHDLEKMPVGDLLRHINEEDRKVPLAIEKQIPAIKALVEAIVPKMKNGGRLFYIGAGTSGRLGIVDASECPPTFGVSHDLVIGLIAGGDTAIRKAVENAEDSKEEAINLVNKKVNKNDFVLGISASASASFVEAGLKQAKKLNATTGLLTCNHVINNLSVDHLISIVVGPEIISGSTRMKAGTATKMILNMISTISMIRLNKTYGNIMVDLKISNKKLLDRGIRIISEIALISYADAAKALKKSKNNVKAAIIMKTKNISLNETTKLLKINDGNLRKIIG